jgi:hypothetical protein
MKHTAFLTICGSEGQKGKNEGKVKGIPSFVMLILSVLLRGKTGKMKGLPGKTSKGGVKLPVSPSFC